MSTYIQNQQMTMGEILKRLGPDGNIMTIGEALEYTNPIIKDAVFKKANNKFTHMSLIRNSKPTGSKRNFNAGVASEASTTEKINDVISMLESYMENDKALVDMSGNPQEVLTQEAKSFVSGMGDTFTSDFFYGNNTTIAQENITGLARRMNTVDGTDRVWNNGGTGSDVTSIYIVQWGLDKVYCTYPEGSPVGLEHRSLGEVTKQDSNGLMWQVYRDHFKWHYGLTVENPRSIARIANIETSGASNLLNVDLLIDALGEMHMGGEGAVIYANSTIVSQLTKAAKDKGNVMVDWSDAFGPGKVLTFQGIPIRRVDKQLLLNTETAIS